MEKGMRGFHRPAKKDTRKKEIKRWISFFLTIVILMTGFSSMPMKAEAASYASEWWLWRQSQSDYAPMRDAGCRVVAFAKAASEAGLYGYSNPDGLYEWGKSNKLFSGNISEKGSFGNLFSSYLKSRGASSSKRVVENVAAKSDAGCKEIMNLLNQGYYVFLASNPHTTYIGREASLKAGTPIVIDDGGQYNFKSYNRSGVKTWNVIGFLINGGAAADTTPPVISNVYVKKNLIGYDVYCDVSDNVGVTKVAFPTWTIKNGQDDLQNPWPVGSQYRQNANGTITYKFNVKASDHNYEQGYYATHIYAYDAADNQSFAAVSSNICLDWAMPDISDIKIVDQSSSGFSVQCKVTDNIGLSQVYCTASSENIKRADKLEGTNNGDIYSFRVNTNDYNGECGIYYIRIYATDQCGNDAIAKAEYTVEAPVKKYTVTFDSQGGTSIAAIKDIVENTKIDKLPDPPTKSDYEFVGWYTEAGGKGVKFDENTVINQDMTVYAFWRLKVPDVPKSFWVDDIPDQTYTGKAVKPQVFVYDGSSLLRENIDYTLTYKKNKKVSDTAPYVIVKGIGEYSGTEKVYFSILPKNIAEDDIEIGSLTVAYFDRVKSAVPTVKWGNKKLEYKKDFKIKYPETDEDPYFVEGRYPIEIVGKGNYTGKRTVQITIRNKKPIKKITVKKIKKQPYSGYSITPELVVKDGRIRLEEDVDYTVSYQNNVNAGTATVVLTGMGKYGGEKRVSFKITRINLKRAVISDIPESIAYTEGDIAIEPRLEIMVGERNVVLKKDEDYTVNVRKNKNADTATVVIKGINNYSGTVKKRIELIQQ